MRIEFSAFNFFHSLAGQSGVLDAIGIFLGKYLGYLLVLGALAIIFLPKENRGKSFQQFLFLALSLIISRGLITEIIRFIYARPRPFAALGFEPLIDHAAAPSFPSGHAVFYFALAMAIWFIAPRWRWYFLAGAALIGLARVFAGLHWPSDILAGALVGLLSVFTVRWILKLRQHI